MPPVPSPARPPQIERRIMNSLRRRLLLFLGFSMAIGLLILVMILGWGLEPKRWFWILGVGLGGALLSSTLTEIARGKEDE